MTLDDRVELVRALMRSGRTPQNAAKAVAKQMDENELFEAATETLKRRALQSERLETLDVERAAEGTSRPRGHAGNCTCEACRQWCERTPRGRHPKRCECEACERWAEITEGSDARHISKAVTTIGDALNRYTEELRITWTQQLLTQSFRLADGTRVTWGEATVEQHQSRIEMLKGNAHANLQAAARHQRAVIDITEGRATTLASLLAAAA